MSNSDSAYRESLELLKEVRDEIESNWHVPYNVAIDSFGLGAAHDAHLLITFDGRRRISTLHELLSVLEDIDKVSGMDLEPESYDGQYGDAVKLTVFLENQ